MRKIIDNIETSGADDGIFVTECLHMPDETRQKPVRLHTLLMLLVRKGTAIAGIDLKDYNLKTGSLLLIQSKNYFHRFETSEDFESTVVAIPPRIIEGLFTRYPELTKLLVTLRMKPCLDLKPHTAGLLQQYSDLLANRLKHPAPLSWAIATNLVQIMLFEIVEAHRISDSAIEVQRNRKEEIVAKFILDVSENFRTERSVTAYADMQFITSKHLSAVVKELTGRTAGRWIENFTIMEAKILLQTTELPIQRIADELCFPNQSFFGKYFRHVTGVSPSQYRKLR